MSNWLSVITSTQEIRHLSILYIQNVNKRKKTFGSDFLIYIS